MMKITEMKKIMEQRNGNNEALQQDSKLFFQAQQDIKTDIFDRREILIAENVLDSEQLEVYKKLKNPWFKNDHSPEYWDRGYTRRHGLSDSPAPSREFFLQNYRAHYDLLNI